MAGSKNPSVCSRPPQDSVPIVAESLCSDDPETLEKEHASMKSDPELAMQNYSKLKNSVDQILALEETLQNAFNENAKLRLMQKEDEKLSTRMETKFSSIQTLGDQLTETWQHLASLVQKENSFGAGQLVPHQILSKDGKPYTMNCETKVFSPEEVTDKVLTKVKEARRVCMSKPFFDYSSSDNDAYNKDDDSWLNNTDPVIDTDDEESDEDMDKALYEGGDPAGIMMACPDLDPLLKKLPAGFEYPFLTNEIAGDLLDEIRFKMVMEALPETSQLMLFNCLSHMFIYWTKKSAHLKQYLTSKSRRKRVLVAAGRVRDQLEHLLCWAYSASDLVSASLVLHGFQKEYFPLCTMYLCENVDPSQLRSHVTEEGEHRCYGSNMHSALLYIQKYGIPKEASEEFNCMLPREVGAEENRYYINGVFKYPTLEEALIRLKTHPVGATLAMFTGCTDKGIYRGPVKEDSKYMGDHEVVMICCEEMRGEMFVKCKSSYEKRWRNKGYIYVSLEVMIILAGSLRKPGDALGDMCQIKPQYLLTDFYSVDMEMSSGESPEQGEKNRKFLVEDDRQYQRSPKQNFAAKKKSASTSSHPTQNSPPSDASEDHEYINHAQIYKKVTSSSGKSLALESIVGNDFLPRGSAAAVRKEIQDETDRETGRSKDISSVPIHLSIYSPNVVNLTLIDLPELTEVVVEGQYESIVKDIENVVRSYIKKPNDIILAILPGKNDLAASDANKISGEVDPSGERTFGALTNIDLMDKGTDAVEILEERSFKLKDPV